jgi:DnaA N-terminal domain
MAAPADPEKIFNGKKLAVVDRIRRDARLTPSTRAVGAEIFSLVNFRTGYAWSPEKYLEEKLGMGLRTIKRAVSQLTKAGYIAIEKSGRNNRYMPNFEAGKVPNWPLSENEQVPNWHLSEADRGQKRREQGPKSAENRGQKGTPISLDNSFRTSTPPEGGRVGAPDGAERAPPNFDLGVPGMMLRQRLGDEVFKSWLGNVAVVSESDDQLVLSAPNKFLANHIKNNFEDAILLCWLDRLPNVKTLTVVVAAPEREAVTSIAERRGQLDAAAAADALWFDEIGIGLVSEQLHESSVNAKKIVRGWLQRCGGDVAGLRRIVTSAVEQGMLEGEFSTFVKQQTKTLLFADQSPLPLGPVLLKRKAS